MAELRFRSLEMAAKRSLPEVKAPSNKISDYFGENAFGIGADAGNLISGCI
jgi:glutamine synthetase